MAHRPAGSRVATSLVVCASLVEKITNQAALCRTCEVLGVDRLVLQRPVHDCWEFRKISASAYRWQPIEYCAPAQLSRWLACQEEYTRVALTVSDAAVPLTEYAFAAKTLLVLGRELTGIPAEIMAKCDVAVSIPQYGRVESLNVQTAGAIASYAYNRQWR